MKSLETLTTRTTSKRRVKALGIVLDQSAFYPTSGGQLNDIGTIQLLIDDENGEQQQVTLNVVNVVVEEPVGRVVHLIDPAQSGSLQSEKLKVGAQIVGEIDWPTRRDYMQQHHGQHILSATFQRLANIDTHSFHMSKKISYIDLNSDNLSEELLSRVQAAVNDTILSRASVSSSFHTISEVNGMSLRKALDAKVVQEPIRIIRISPGGDDHEVKSDEDCVDIQPCCGTHPSNSSEVGSLIILGTEKMKKMTRLSFICGVRVTAYATSSAQTLKQMALKLCCAPDCVEQALVASLDASANVRKQFSDAEKLLVQKVAKEIHAGASPSQSASFDLCVQVMSDELSILGDLGNMRKLVREPVFASECVVALLSPSEGSNAVNFMIGASDDLVKDKIIDLRNWIKDMFKEAPGKGGGAATMIQGSFSNTVDAKSLKQMIETSLRAL